MSGIDKKLKQALAESLGAEPTVVASTKSGRGSASIRHMSSAILEKSSSSGGGISSFKKMGTG